MPRRIALNVPDSHTDDFDTAVTASGGGHTATVLRGIRLLARVVRHQKTGGHIALVNTDGTQTRIEFL